jgi:phospholipase/carboxylesterase
MATFIEAVRRERPTRGTPILTGFSQGGLLTFAVAVRHPEGVGAAFPVAGLLPRSLWPRANDRPYPPITALHGTEDRIVAYDRARATVTHMKRLGLEARLQTFEGTGHRFTRRMKARLRALVRRAVARPGDN